MSDTVRGCENLPPSGAESIRGPITTDGPSISVQLHEASVTVQLDEREQ